MSAFYELTFSNIRCTEICIEKASSKVCKLCVHCTRGYGSMKCSFILCAWRNVIYARLKIAAGLMELCSRVTEILAFDILWRLQRSNKKRTWFFSKWYYLHKCYISYGQFFSVYVFKHFSINIKQFFRKRVVFSNF